MQCGSTGTPSHRNRGARKRTDGAYGKQRLRKVDGIFHFIFNVKYKKVDVLRKVGLAGVTGDSLGSQSPVLVLPWLCESENPNVPTR